MAVKCEWGGGMGWGGVAGLFLALDAWYKQTNSPEETQPAKRSGDLVRGVGGILLSARRTCYCLSRPDVGKKDRKD